MPANLQNLIILFLLPCFIWAQDSTEVVPKRIYMTTSLGQNTPPEIDGILNDASWELAEWTGDYIEWQPDENTPPSQQTKFKIIYDTSSLYVAFRCYDTEPDKIEQRLSRRDGFSGDWVEINIDSYYDKRTSFSFTITAAGVKGDELVSNNGNNWDSSWNPIWYAKTNTDEEGWTAEIRIPLSQIKFSGAADQVWGLQSTRRFFREEERSLWQRVPRDAPGWVSEFGELHGLKNLSPQKQLEIQPYTVFQWETHEPEEGNPFRDGTEGKIPVGLDAKIGVTNDLTLDLTINPDFGQVEADPSAIALDGFQIFFREQRPFFIENKNIFNYPLSRSQAGNTFGFDNVFYSRRIGRDPQGSPDLADNEFTSIPTNTTILGAAKFSGKTKNGWSIGILESITAKEYAEIDNDGERREELVEPLSNYFVGRLQKDFNDRNTYIGGIFTATNRESLPESLNFLHTDAFSGGLDFKHQWNDRDWYIGGNFVWSHVRGSEEAITATQESIAHLFQRIDATHVAVDSSRTSLTGTNGNLQIGKVGDGRWKFETGGTWRSPELELNDIGFQRQADDIRHYTWVGYRTLKPDKVFRTVGLNYNHWSVWDFGGNHNSLRFNVNSWANFKNNWFANIGFNYAPLQYDNFALRGGPRLRLSPEYSFWNGVESDSRKKLSFGIFHNGQWAVDNSYARYNIETGLNYQPTNALRISAWPQWGINNDQLQFIDNLEANGEPRYLNGTIAQRTFSMSFRLNYTINPNLSIQYWGQPFISKGNYSEFKHVSNPLAKDFANRITPYSEAQINLVDNIYFVDDNLDGNPDFSFENPDFSVVQFRSNLVIRWEYKPGSELFFVWSQDIAQSGDPMQSLSDGLQDNLFNGERPTNIFLIKATYRFVF